MNSYNLIQLFKLAREYHQSTEAYDRSVCTGPYINGCIWPNSGHERHLINQNARYEMNRLTMEAYRLGFSKNEFLSAIQRVRL